MTLKNDLLTAIDKAIQESPRERSMRESRELLSEVRRRFGDAVAAGYADCPWRPRALREMKALLDGPSPAKAPTPAPAKATEVPPLLPPKPTPARIETAVLHRLLFHSVKTHLPADYCSLDERQQRRALLTAAWRSHCETALPTSLGPEVEAATAGLRRRELTGSVRTEAAFRKETITKSLKKARITTK